MGGLSARDESLLLELYKENLAYSRFHEEMREASTRIILLVAGGMFALISSGFAKGQFDLIISLGLIVLGVFGYFLSRAHSAKQKEHYDQASTYIDTLLNSSSDRIAVRKASRKARNAARDKGPKWMGERLRISGLWSTLNLMIIVGAIASALSLVWR
jgi:hypothetical protein